MIYSYFANDSFLLKFAEACHGGFVLLFYDYIFAVEVRCIVVVQIDTSLLSL